MHSHGVHFCWNVAYFLLHQSFHSRFLYVFVCTRHFYFFDKAVILGPMPLLRLSVGLTYLLQSFLHPLFMNGLSLPGCFTVLWLDIVTGHKWLTDILNRCKNLSISVSRKLRFTWPPRRQLVAKVKLNFVVASGDMDLCSHFAILRRNLW